MRAASFDAPRMATERGESRGVRPAKRDAPAGVAVGIGLGIPSSSCGAIGRPCLLPGSLALVATCRKTAGAVVAGQLGEGADRAGGGFRRKRRRAVGRELVHGVLLRR